VNDETTTLTAAMPLPEKRLSVERAGGKTPEKPVWNRAQRRAFTKGLPRETRAAIKRGEVKL
jgi:hypothetical protein